MSLIKKLFEFFMGERKEDEFKRDLNEVKRLSKTNIPRKSNISWIDEFREELEIDRIRKKSLRQLVEEE